MDPTLFQKFRDLAYETAGIDFAPGKEDLVGARLARRLRDLGLRDAREYLRYLEQDVSGDEILRLMDALTTNYTQFFRDPDHFDLLRHEVRRLLAAGPRRMRFWSAACATGEEPYSMAMTILEVPGAAETDFKVLATDLSMSALDEARKGVYPAARVEHVGATRCTRFFSFDQGPEGRTFEVRPDLRSRVFFHRLNLAKPPFPMRGPLDVVFCRNVMIYFDDAVRRRLIAQIEQLLRPGGLLVLSRSENVHGIRCDLTPVGRAVYRRNGAGGGA